MCGKYGPYIEFPGGQPYRPEIDGPKETERIDGEIPGQVSPVDGRYDRRVGNVTAGPRDSSSSGSPDAI